MKKIETFEKWLVEYDLNDGARLSRLCFDGFDLLTTAPRHFKQPEKDFGLFETRPVYGYDDCFPSVESCLYPGADWNIPDHGELCWLDWDLDHQPDKLVFSVKSKLLPVIFKRTMHFKESELCWQFELINHSSKDLPFQHVMHPLIKPNEIKNIRFPEFDEVWNEQNELLSIQGPESLSQFLLNSPKGSVHMLYIQGVKAGSVSLVYRNGLEVRMNFPKDLFPTLGVWWNNSGYPDEDGCRRSECAFEPIAGLRSSLLESFEKNRCQFVKAHAAESWEITWSVVSAG